MISQAFFNKNITRCYECFDETGNRRKCLKCRRYYHQTCLKSDEDRRTAMGIKMEKKGTGTMNYFGSNGDEPINYNQCYPCTLLERGQNRNFQTMSKEEINYLLNYVLKHIVVWSSDVALSYLEHVERKIRRNKYDVLEKFLVDILDVCDQIATDYGSK